MACQHFLTDLCIYRALGARLAYKVCTTEWVYHQDMNTLLGPNAVIGEIYSSGWFNYLERFTNTIRLEKLPDPDILSGSLIHRDICHTLVYNEIVLQTGRFECRLLYCPEEGSTTTLLLYGKTNDLVVEKENMVAYTTSVRDAETGGLEDVCIRLSLSDRALGCLVQAQAAH